MMLFFLAVWSFLTNFRAVIEAFALLGSPSLIYRTKSLPPVNFDGSTCLWKYVWSPSSYGTLMCIEVGRALAWAILNPFLIGEPLRVS